VIQAVDAAMLPADRLRDKLITMNGKGFQVYQELAGAYRFDRFVLYLDSIQPDPVAAATRARVRVDQAEAQIPPELWDTSVRRVAVLDYLARAVHEAIRKQVRTRWSGRIPPLAMDACGQAVLSRASCTIVEDTVEVRLAIGLPSEGRKVLAKTAQSLFFEELPAVVDAGLMWPRLDGETGRRHVQAVEDYVALRDALEPLGLVAFALGLADHLKDAVTIAQGLHEVMLANDADLVEVNPLALVREPRPGGPVERLALLDAKITIDDSALPRHPDLEAMRDLDEEDPLDAEARAAGLSFIRLDGDIGCMVNGAGLAMTTMDLVKRAGGSPANFLDIGGGARSDKVAEAMRLILSEPSVKAILVNIFGGIARGDEVARGLVEARSVQTRSVPMVVRIVGTNADLAVGILAGAGGGVETAATLDEAVERAVALSRAVA